jgi:AcrR family transcriptional regulator
MPDPQPRDSRQAIAQRNVELILDAAEGVLQRGGQPNISTVAAAAGVSRPTVYAHFDTLELLIEALVERTVRRTMAAIQAAEPDRGPAIDALQRLLATSWEQLGRHQHLARAAAGELSADAMRRAHHEARAAIAKLIRRGRREGTIRTDLTQSWLVTTALALIHAAAEEVRGGELGSDAALDALSSTVTELLGARRAHPGGKARTTKQRTPPTTRDHRSRRLTG